MVKKGAAYVRDLLIRINTYCPCCKHKLRKRSFRSPNMRKNYREEVINLS